MTLYVDITQLVTAYASFAAITRTRPRSAIGSNGLALNARVEIECIAVSNWIVAALLRWACLQQTVSATTQCTQSSAIENVSKALIELRIG